MKKDLTEIVVVLDRSGSMQPIRDDMCGAFDGFIKEQQKLPGACTVTLVQFDDIVEPVYAGKNLLEVPALELVPRGMTALHDAIGKTISETGQRLASLKEDERPERVLFVVISDGGENSSHEYNGARIAEMVKHQTTKYNWQFVYFGANQDAITVSHQLGINIAQNFQATASGIGHAMNSMNIGTRSYRSGQGYNS